MRLSNEHDLRNTKAMIYRNTPLQYNNINNNIYNNNLNEIYIHNGSNIINNKTNINTLRRSQSVSNITNNNYSLYNQYNHNNNTMHYPLHNIYQVNNCNYSLHNNNIPYTSVNELPRKYNNKPSIYEINLSYNTFELTKEQKQRNKQLYKSELLSQIKEKQMKQYLEVQNRINEDKKDEERIRIQNVELQKSFEEEWERKKNDPTDKFNIKSSSKKQRNIYNNDNYIDEDLDEDGLPINLPPEEKKKILKEREEEKKVRNELMMLTKQFQEQNDQFMNTINDLQKETKDANAKRFTDLIEIEKIKAELDQKREDERILKRNMFDNLRYGGDNLRHVMSDKLQSNEIINNSLLNSKEYLLCRDSINNTNQRYLPLSSLNIFEKDKEESKEYVYKLKLNDESKINKSNDNNNRTSQKHEVIESNLNNNNRINLNKNQIDLLTYPIMEIDHIYNKNLTRLKLLNNIENQMVSK